MMFDSHGPLQTFAKVARVRKEPFSNGLLNTSYLKPLLWLRVIHARTFRAEAPSHIDRYRERGLLGSGPRYVARNQVLPQGSVMVAARSPYGAV